MSNLNKPYSKMLKFESDFMTDYEASIQLNHKKEDESSHICMVDGIDLYLFGCVTLLTPDGNFVYGDSVMALIYTEIKASKSELVSFLQGVNVPAFEGYQVTTNPWFEWQDRDGETVGEVFDEIPSDISKLVKPD